MGKVTVPQVKRLVRKWQPILGLNNHSITVAVAEFHNGGVLAETLSRADSSRAQVVVNVDHDAIANGEDSIGRTSLEETVVHELLHIVMSEFKGTAFDCIHDADLVEVLRQMEERTVDRLSLALVRKFNER